LTERERERERKRKNESKWVDVGYGRGGGGGGPILPLNFLLQTLHSHSIMDRAIRAKNLSEEVINFVLL